MDSILLRAKRHSRVAAKKSKRKKRPKSARRRLATVSLVR
jgi:hypothetical protein